MAPKFLLDTSVCIYVLRAPLGSLPEALERYWVEDAAISTISRAELEVGVWKGGRPDEQRRRLALLLARIPVVPFDEAAAFHYGEIRAQLEQAGLVIGPLDQLIAAHARSLGATLLTGNEKEFLRVPGLRCQACRLEGKAADARE